MTFREYLVHALRTAARRTALTFVLVGAVVTAIVPPGHGDKPGVLSRVMAPLDAPITKAIVQFNTDSKGDPFGAVLNLNAAIQAAPLSAIRETHHD